MAQADECYSESDCQRAASYYLFYVIQYYIAVINVHYNRLHCFYISMCKSLQQKPLKKSICITRMHVVFGYKADASRSGVTMHA